jgi:hypothetical protein
MSSPLSPAVAPLQYSWNVTSSWLSAPLMNSMLRTSNWPVIVWQVNPSLTWMPGNPARSNGAPCARQDYDLDLASRCRPLVPAPKNMLGVVRLEHAVEALVRARYSPAQRQAMSRVRSERKSVPQCHAATTPQNY